MSGYFLLSVKNLRPHRMSAFESLLIISGFSRTAGISISLSGYISG